MSEPSPDEAPEKSAVGRTAVEVATAFVLLVIGLVVAWDSRRLGASWGSDGPQSGYFPFYIGVLLGLSAIGVLVEAIRAKDGKSFVSVPRLKLVLAMLLPSLAYVAGVQWLGFYVASAAFIAAFMMWQGKFAAWKSFATGIGICVALYCIFEVWFKIPLIKGPLEAALGV
jgi:putative tricarboxylic transport membrane protein